MLLNRDGRVFAGQRRDSALPAWQMPQGGIDAGEEPRAAALRELEEETGVPASAVEVLAETPDWITYDLPAELVPKVWKGRYRGQRQRWFLMRLPGDDALIDIATADPEFSAWTWMEPRDWSRGSCRSSAPSMPRCSRPSRATWSAARDVGRGLPERSASRVRPPHSLHRFGGDESVRVCLPPAGARVFDAPARQARTDYERTAMPSPPRPRLRSRDGNRAGRRLRHAEGDPGGSA